MSVAPGQMAKTSTSESVNSAASWRLSAATAAPAHPVRETKTWESSDASTYRTEIDDLHPYALAADATQTAREKRDLSLDARPTIQNVRYLRTHWGTVCMSKTVPRNRIGGLSHTGASR